jgi:hypothetical protein
VPGFLRVLRFPLPIFITPTAPQSPSYIMWGLYNRPVVAAVPSGLSVTPLIIIIIIIILLIIKRLLRATDKSLSDYTDCHSCLQFPPAARTNHISTEQQRRSEQGQSLDGCIIHHCFIAHMVSEHIQPVESVVFVTNCVMLLLNSWNIREFASKLLDRNTENNLRFVN